VAPPRFLPFILVLPFGIGAVLIFLRWPMLGLAALLVASLMVPSPDLPGGFNLAVLFLAMLIGLWLLQLFMEEGGLRLVPSATVKPLLWLIIAVLLAFGVGQLPWFSFGAKAPLSAQVGGLTIYLLAVGAFLLVAHQVRDLRWLERLTWMFLALAGWYIVGWAVPAMGTITTPLFQQDATSNSMFWTWFVALAFSQAWLNKKLHWGWRLTLAALVLVALYVAYFMNGDWKSGWIPPLASIAAIIGLRSWRAGLAVALLGLFMARDLFARVVASDEYSYSTRVDAAQTVLEMAKVNPITGFGPANYYWSTPLFRIRGYWDVVFASHNQYVDIIAQIGLLGLACVLWFFWEVGRLGWRLRSRVPDGFALAYVYGALGGLAGMLVAGMLVDWFLPFVYTIGLRGFRGSMLAWLFLGGLVSLEQIVQQQAPSQSSHAESVLKGVTNE
jgi:hypothetical protein